MHLIVLILFSLSSIAFGDDRLDKLTKRIEELEKQQEELLLLTPTDSQKTVNSFLKDGLTFGGFFEPSYTVIAGPDTEFQSTNSSNILGINIAAEYRKDLRFVSQFINFLIFPLQNEHNNPNSSSGQGEREFGSPMFGTLLTQGYLEYNLNSNYSIQGGVGYTPFGYSFQQREPVLFIRRGGPQVLRTSDLVSPLWSGFNLNGNFSLEDSSWGFNLYTFSPVNSPKHPGIGARTFWASYENKLATGLSLQLGKIGARNYETLGTDVRLNFSPFLITSEVVYGQFEGSDAWSMYLEPAIYLFDEEYLFYVFGDFTDNKNNRDGAGPNSSYDPYQKWEYGFGVNWLPTAFTRIRMGLVFHDYVSAESVIRNQDRDYTSLDTSVGVAF